MSGTTCEKPCDSTEIGEKSRSALSEKRELLESYQTYCDLVGALLCQFSSYELFETLVKEQVFEELPLSLENKRFKEGAVLLADWNKSLDGELGQESYHELASDNTFLFAGLQEMAVPPWESFYFNKERMIFQEEAMQVRAWYRRYGMQVNKLNSEPDDHIGLEMIFIARLIEAALRERTPDALLDARSFLSKHPLRWAAKWASGVLNHAKTDLYKGLALIIPPSLAGLEKELEAIVG